jgi:hypothetical protein
MTTHCVLPDMQVKEGVDLSYLTWVGQYLADKKPDVIVNIGDFADMPSLSSYDVGKKSFEGRRYRSDIEVTHKAMDMLLAPIKEQNERARRNKERQYKPRMVLTLGNHEQRISRAVEGDPKLDGTLSLDDLGYKERGWEVIPFLEPVIIDDIVYSHYFTSGVMGRPVTSARALLVKKHMSALWVMFRRRHCLLTIVQTVLRSQHCSQWLLLPSRRGLSRIHRVTRYWRGIWMLYECGAVALMSILSV